MSAHRLCIRGGPQPGTIQLELDGQPLRGVLAFAVSADIRDGAPARATLVLRAELDVDAEVLAETGEARRAAPR